MDSVNVSLLQIEMWCGGKVTAVPFCGDTSRVLHARPTRSPGNSQRGCHPVCTLRSKRKIPDLEVSFNLAEEVECWDSWVHYFADRSQKNNDHLHEIGIREKQSGVHSATEPRRGWGWGACPIMLVNDANLQKRAPTQGTKQTTKKWFIRN